MCIPSVYLTMTDWIRSLIDDDGTVASRGALAQLEALEADAERARVVGVLDAWALELSEGDRGCDGHEPEHWQEQGVTAYCDGSCKHGRKRHTPKLWWVERDTTANGLPGYAVHTDEADTFPIVTGTPDDARAAAAKAIEAVGVQP